MSQEGIGRLLEESGWLQGAIIGPEYIERILSASTCIDVDAQAIERRDVVLVVATQSCNLVNEAVNTTQLCIEIEMIHRYYDIKLKQNHNKIKL